MWSYSTILNECVCTWTAKENMNLHQQLNIARVHTSTTERGVATETNTIIITYLLGLVRIFADEPYSWIIPGKRSTRVTLKMKLMKCPLWNIIWFCIFSKSHSFLIWLSFTNSFTSKSQPATLSFGQFTCKLSTNKSVPSLSLSLSLFLLSFSPLSMKSSSSIYHNHYQCLGSAGSLLQTESTQSSGHL